MRVGAALSLPASTSFGGRRAIGNPSDPDSGWGRARSWERFRFVTSGIFQVPWGLRVSAIYAYGSGQPWNRVYGYDYNGDFSRSDRLPGMDRNDQDGPRFSQFDLKVAKVFPSGSRGSIEISVEIFNLFNTVNYHVESVDGSMYFDGSTIDNPDVPFITNPDFGVYRETYTPREVQLGLGYTYQVR